MLVGSLTAINHLVFREHATTMDQPVDAVSATSEGHARLRQQYLASPKWGRNDRIGSIGVRPFGRAVRCLLSPHAK